MTNLLNSLGGTQIIEKVSQQTGISTEQINYVVNNLLSSNSHNIQGLLENNNTQQFAESISTKTGISQDIVSKVLGSLTPMLGELISKKGDGNIGSMISNLLDKNNDGNVVDDISEMILGKNNPLGGFFGKK